MQSFSLASWSTPRQPKDTPGTLSWDLLELLGVLWYCHSPGCTLQAWGESHPIAQRLSMLGFAQAISAEMQWTSFHSGSGKKCVHLSTLTHACSNSQWFQWCPLANLAAVLGWISWPCPKPGITLPAQAPSFQINRESIYCNAGRSHSHLTVTWGDREAPWDVPKPQGTVSISNCFLWKTHCAVACQLEERVRSHPLRWIYPTRSIATWRRFPKPTPFAAEENNPRPKWSKVHWQCTLENIKAMWRLLTYIFIYWAVIKSLRACSA